MSVAGGAISDIDEQEEDVDHVEPDVAATRVPAPGGSSRGGFALFCAQHKVRSRTRANGAPKEACALTRMPLCLCMCQPTHGTTRRQVQVKP